jgi:hypothetical protein
LQDLKALTIAEVKGKEIDTMGEMEEAAVDLVREFYQPELVDN